MDCIGQPGTDLEFYADIKSGFGSSVRLISFSGDTLKVFGCFENVWGFFSADFE